METIFTSPSRVYRCSLAVVSRSGLHRCAWRVFNGQARPQTRLIAPWPRVCLTINTLFNRDVQSEGRRCPSVVHAPCHGQPCLYCAAPCHAHATSLPLLPLCNASPLCPEQKAGDLLYAPANWRHITLNIGETIGVGGQAVYDAEVCFGRCGASSGGNSKHSRRTSRACRPERQLQLIVRAWVDDIQNCVPEKSRRRFSDNCTCCTRFSLQRSLWLMGSVCGEPVRPPSKHVLLRVNVCSSFVMCGMVD